LQEAPNISHDIAGRIAQEKVDKGHRGIASVGDEEEPPCWIKDQQEHGRMEQLLKWRSTGSSFCGGQMNKGAVFSDDAWLPETQIHNADLKPLA
jgi:hypothetical protein